MAEKGSGLSRNPNVCASCSSLADGMEESSLPAEQGEESRPVPFVRVEVSAMRERAAA